MKITFLGTGTSQGVPIIGCNCPVCQSEDPHDQRLRSSVQIEVDGVTIIIDTGPDFRQQMLRAQTKKVDAILFTHGHKDHIAGLDDIRAFNFIQKSAIDVYCSPITHAALRREFDYVFSEYKYPGIPELTVHEITNEAFEIKGVRIVPIKVWHYKMEVYGFRIKDFTYITDANRIDASELEKAMGTKVFVLSALRREVHISHFTLDEAIDVSKKVAAAHTYFTHISHQLGFHTDVNKELPDNYQLAYDGLELLIQ